MARRDEISISRRLSPEAVAEAVGSHSTTGVLMLLKKWHPLLEEHYSKRYATATATATAY